MRHWHFRRKRRNGRRHRVLACPVVDGGMEASEMDRTWTTQTLMAATPSKYCGPSIDDLSGAVEYENGRPRGLDIRTATRQVDERR